MEDVDPELVVGAATEVIAGENLIATAGGVDSHIHFISPQQVYEALSNGITTMVGGGTGPATGTAATTCSPGAWNLGRMLQASEAWPLNFGFLGKGNSSTEGPLEELIQAGACGLKLHEDWGTTPAAIDACLRVADRYDVQVSIHTDTINEVGFLEATVAAIGRRAIHTCHTEGAGGVHAPDIIRIASFPNVLPSSTNPTRPYTVNTLAEHLDMLMVCHHLNPLVPEDVVLWKPAFFGVKPEMVVKGGFIAWSAMGDPNALIPTPQPVLYRPMFGSFGGAIRTTSTRFVSQAALAKGIAQKLGLRSTVVPVRHCRQIGKKDLIHNDSTPQIEVDPETYDRSTGMAKAASSSSSVDTPTRP